MSLGFVTPCHMVPFCGVGQQHGGRAGARHRGPQGPRAYLASTSRSCEPSFPPLNHKPERPVHRAPGLGVYPLREVPKRGPNAPHMGPPRWLWVTRRAIPSWGNHIALKSPFVHFFVQSEPEEAQGAPPNVPWVEKGGRPEPIFVPLLESATFTVREDKEESRLPKQADNEVE